MAAVKRTPIQREDDYRRISELYLKKKTQGEIAEVIGVTQQQVSYDIERIKRRWRVATVINMDEAKAETLEEIAVLKRDYYEAWERSQLEYINTKTEQARAGDKAGTIRAVVEKETPGGNPAYLKGVEWCISERAKVLGLYAPVKQENKNDGAVTLRVVYETDGQTTETT